MKKVVVNGVEVWVPAKSGGPQQEDMIDKCFETFEGFPEGKYAFFETNESTTIVYAAVGWILHHLSDATVIDKSKILYICGSDWECLKRFEEFESTVSGGHVRMIMLDSRETMEKVFLKDVCEQKNCFPQVIFTTHTFLLQEVLSGSSVFPSLQKEKQLTLQDTLVIVDDAHVLEDSCINVGSRALSICKVEKCCKKLDTIRKLHSDFVNLYDLMEKFKSVYRGILPYNGGDKIVSYDRNEIKALFTFYVKQLVNECEQTGIIDIPVDMDILKFIFHIFRFHENENCNDNFKMYSITEFKREQHVEECNGEGCKTFELVCLDPSVVMGRIVKLDPHSLIITGTTVTPFRPLMDVLGFSQAKKFEFLPVVEDFKIFARIVSCGAGGYFLNSNESVRQDADYRIALGKTILEILALTPSSKGIIVFFPAYDMIQDCKTQWKKHLVSKQYSLWNMFCTYRDTFSVARDSAESIEQDEVSCKNLLGRLTKCRKETSKGCCMMTVFRGQVYKDLTAIPHDDRRVVVMAGFPYPPISDPKIRLRRDFHSSQHQKNKSTMDGGQFLSREAYKAVRQVIDRQIDVMSQHHGILLLCDIRYDPGHLSKWMQARVSVEKRFKELLLEMKDFSDSIDQRVEWFDEAKSGSTQLGTQFGGVRPWELEKVRLDYIKFLRGNEILKVRKKSLEKRLENLIFEKEELQKTLNKKSQALLQEPEGGNHTAGSGDQQQADAEMVEEKNGKMSSSPQRAEEENMDISFSPLKISSRKRPYPPQTKGQ